ncbi:MAG: hypothetical protein ABEK59_06865 [Halobacteria archaeon]
MQIDVLETCWTEVDQKGRCTIPKKVREACGIDAEKEKENVKLAIVQVGMD